MAINEKNSIFNFNIAFLGLSEDEYDKAIEWQEKIV